MGMSMLQENEMKFVEDNYSGPDPVFLPEKDKKHAFHFIGGGLWYHCIRCWCVEEGNCGNQGDIIMLELAEAKLWAALRQ